MGDLKSRFAPLFRRSSTSSARSSALSSPKAFDSKHSRSRTSLLSKTRKSSLGSTTVYEESEVPPPLPPTPLVAESQVTGEEVLHTSDTGLKHPDSTPLEKSGNPTVSVQAPTPDLLTATSGPDAGERPTDNRELLVEAVTRRKGLSTGADQEQPPPPSNQSSSVHKGLITSNPAPSTAETGYFGEPTKKKMSFRKIWVKRAGASATLVQITEDDLVDDVRDRILKKYGNSLGRSFDAPDVTLRIIPGDQSRPVRHPPAERTLGPEEPMNGVLDSYFPSGQTVENALIIDVPRRTPRHSPRPAPYHVEDLRPVESGSDYFPIMPAGQPSPHLPTNVSVASGHTQSSHHLPPHSMSVLNTGQVPPLPSPSIRNPRHGHRPRIGRTQATSPTVMTAGVGSQSHGRHPSVPGLRAVTELSTSDSQKPFLNGAPVPPPLPTPPIPSDIPHRTATPPARASSPRPKNTNKSARKPKDDTSKLPTGLLNGAVPPINVLIVEDNIINLKLLEAFMKRLKVRWHTAMNGREAVSKWRGGGFHLVLMDIQLPVMNGLDATKEIRRLERLNNIGVFSSSSTNGSTTFGNGVVGTEGADEGSTEKVEEEEEDTSLNTALFKSPVIIVALTASSLQSDRHEALAAGCNDFLTKVFPLTQLSTS